MIGRVVSGLVLDAGLSVGAYLILRAVGSSIFTALVAGMIVAAARAAYVIIRRRTVDAFVLFMIFTFAVGLGLALLGGSPRFLIARDSIGTAVSGIVFLITLGVGRPMMYYFSQRFAAPTAELRAEWNQRWEKSPGFRRAFRRLTLVWGVAFVVEAAVKLVCILTFPIDVMAVLSPFFTPALIVVLLVWTIRSAPRRPAA